MSSYLKWKNLPSEHSAVDVTYVIKVEGFDVPSLVTIDLQCHHKGIGIPLLGPWIVKLIIKNMSTLYSVPNFVHQHATINALLKISECSTLRETSSSMNRIQMSKLCLAQYMHHILISTIRFKLSISFIKFMTTWTSFVLIKNLLIDT